MSLSSEENNNAGNGLYVILSCLFLFYSNFNITVHIAR
jgi:hypothetical protein